MASNFDADLVVIGAGPGGYVAAIRAAQLGAKTIVVEKEFLGGTCLNWGCIPSKVLIATVDRYLHVKHADKLSVVVKGDVSIDFDAMMARKDKIVQTQRNGIAGLFKKHKIEHVEGFAKFIDPNTIEVAKGAETRRIRAKYFILATGSSVVKIPIEGLEGGPEQGVWTSDDALFAKGVPKRMLVVGAGAVGVEFSHIYNTLGSQVTLVEMMERVIPLMDDDLGVELEKLLTRQGIKVKTGTQTKKVRREGEVWKCTLVKGDQTEEVEVDVILLGVGRKANTDGLDLEHVGVKLHKRGVEVVDDTMQTHAPNIYAIGDVRGDIQLAHVASAEGILAATNAVKGLHKKFDKRAIPACVYTNPEVAVVGLSEAQAKEQGYEVEVGRYGFRALGKAMASAEQDGFVKVVADKKYGELLGVHMIGAHVTDLIHEAVVAIKLEATIDYMVETIHAHPTMAEACLEAYEDVHGMAIHK